ncbi:MAG: hypothetical protein ACTHM7_11690, partial [Ginsengibacter sp.]
HAGSIGGLQNREIKISMSIAAKSIRFQKPYRFASVYPQLQITNGGGERTKKNTFTSVFIL